MENDPNVAWLARTYRNLSLTKAFALGFLLGNVFCLGGLLMMARSAHADTRVSHPIDVDAPSPSVRRRATNPQRPPVTHMVDWTTTPHFVCRYSPVLSDKDSEVWLCARGRRP
jgi:hypothetical protein